MILTPSSCAPGFRSGDGPADAAFVSPPCRVSERGGKTLTEFMQNKQDPLLAVVLAKLGAIERSIDRLTEQVKITNGRVTELEKIEAQEQAVHQHIEEAIEAEAIADHHERDRRVALVVGACSFLAALTGSVVGLIAGGI